MERKIIKVLEHLETEELLQFRTFIYSPYFNVNQEIINLFDIIYITLTQEKKQMEMGDEYVWQLLFPGLPFDSKKFNRLFYITGSLFDRFISQQEYEKIPLYQHKIKGDVIQKVPNKSLQKKVHNETSAYIQKNDTYSVEDMVHTYFNTNIFRNLKGNKDAVRHLNTYYVLEKLNSYISILSLKKMYKTDVHLHFMDYIFEMLLDRKYMNHPSINIFMNITNTLLDENEDIHYYTLRKLMIEHVDKFKIEVQKEIYSTAISYCINKVNQTIVEFYDETFDLFKESVEKNVLLENNEISVPVFRNIIIAALRVKQYAWVENFIENYKIYVHPKYRDNAVYFSLARLEINRENYDKVLEYLQLINYEDVWYQLGAKTMQITAYYELKEFDALESLLNAYKMFITREKSLSKERKKAYFNLIKYTKKLLYILPDEKAKIAKMRKEIEENNTVVTKTWLLEKVDELKTRR